MALDIKSRDNKLFKQWISLQTSKGIDRHGLALVSGRKIVPELFADGGEATTLIVREGAPHLNPLPKSRARATRVEEKLFEALDEFGTDAPLLVLPLPDMGRFESTQKPPTGLTLALATQDPSNLGAIMRSALAFDVDQIVLLAECAHPFLPRVTRAAAGANFRIRLLKGPSIKALDTEWIALDMKGEALDKSWLPEQCALLLGEEGMGIPDSFAGRRVKIPISSKVDSLNVGVAAGIILANYRRSYPLVKRA